VKRTLLAMALLLTSVFGVTGCGSDDDVAVESRVKNAAPATSGASDGPSESDCDSLLVDDLDDLYDGLLDLLDRSDRSDLRDDIDDLYDDLYDLRDEIIDGLFVQCDAAASDSGTAIDDESDSAIDDDMPSAPTTLPAVDDAVSDDSTESASVCFDPAVEQFREDLALFRVAQTGRNDQSLTEEQRQGHIDNYASAYDVKTKSAAAAIQVANERGYSFDVDSPDQLDESFLRSWDSRFCD
jgi:hypothetical protein